MSDNSTRHMLAALATLLSVLFYWVGYISGGAGWWWTAILLIFVYTIVYKMVHP